MPYTQPYGGFEQIKAAVPYALDGLSFSELAALCGCSKSSVQGSIEAVRKKFQKILRNHPYE